MEREVWAGFCRGLSERAQAAVPPVVFGAGRTELLGRVGRVAVVGSRAATPAGLGRAGRFARAVVEAGGVVVSGLAEGIDGAAHRAALAARGDTIAVLGTPLDRCSPAAHRSLQETLGREGLVLSQFPAGLPTRPYHFLQRNLTLALLSHGVFIAEAGDGSGSQKMAQLALDWGIPLALSAEWLEQARGVWPQTMLLQGATALPESGWRDWIAARGARYANLGSS
ncbi:MAG: hypothetical protein RJA19_740 [Bacteroidota bacterium]